jgi:hypothetical protein
VNAMEEDDSEIAGHVKRFLTDRLPAGTAA